MAHKITETTEALPDSELWIGYRFNMNSRSYIDSRSEFEPTCNVTRHVWAKAGFAFDRRRILIDMCARTCDILSHEKELKCC